jgi:hypothetical protein
MNLDRLFSEELTVQHVISASWHFGARTARIFACCIPVRNHADSAAGAISVCALRLGMENRAAHRIPRVY